MNRTDMMMLALAGVMALTAGGVWAAQRFTRDDAFIERPVEPSPDLPSFSKVEGSADDARREKYSATDDATGSTDRDRARSSFLKAARQFRASPCNAQYKTTYLAAFSDYVGVKLADIRRTGGEDRTWETPKDYQIIEYMDRFEQDNFLTPAEYRDAMRAATPGLAVGLLDEGSAVDHRIGPTACEAHTAGEPMEPMSWER